MGSIGHIGQTGFHLPQDFEQSLNQGGSAGSGALENSPLEQLRTDPLQQGTGAAQGAGGPGSGSGGDVLSILRGIEDELKQLLQLGVGGTAPGQSSPSSSAGDNSSAAAPSSEAGLTPSSAAPSSAGPSDAPVSSGAAPSSGDPSNAASSSGSSVNIDGGNADGRGVVEKVDNNTGAAASFGWENSQGKLVGKLDLASGQSGAFDVNANGQDGKSARLIKLNSDGSIPTNSNLDETNLAVNPDGSLQVSPDVSQITAGNDPTQITITDGNGKSVGNGASGGTYQYPTQDQVADPKGNPMTMAMDTSNQYDNNFKS